MKFGEMQLQERRNRERHELMYFTQQHKDDGALQVLRLELMSAVLGHQLLRPFECSKGCKTYFRTRVWRDKHEQDCLGG